MIKLLPLSILAVGFVATAALAQSPAKKGSSTYRRIAPDAPLLPDLSESSQTDSGQKVETEEAIAALVQEGKLAARPEEEVILPGLNGIVLIDEENELVPQGLPNQRGIDLTQVDLQNKEMLTAMLSGFLNQPTSFESIGRIRLVVRHYLRTQGRPFSLVYTPPQDITEGSLQIYVKPSRIEQPLRVTGAEHFSEQHYRKRMRIDFDGPIDQQQLNKDAAWISKNPYRQVVVVTEAGKTPGTTAIELRVDETRPWRLNAGYENTGTPSSGEHRLKAGFNWGNAFWRGDLLDYQYRTDTDFEFSESHSASYTMFLPWYHQMTIFGAYSEVVSDLPEPLNQTGTSWQLGTRYTIDVDSEGALTHGLTLGLDFKESDNTLTVDQIPIFNNPTQIFQMSLGYQAALRRQNSITSASGLIFYSPGGVTDENSDLAYEGSRAGAEASYVYWNVNLSHQHRLPADFTWSTEITGQWSSTNLLGSEQVAASGVYGVRGYAENALYADNGILARNELSFPAFSPMSLLTDQESDKLQFYLFGDYALVSSSDALPDEPSSTDIASVGAGLSYRFADNLSINLSYGHKLIDLYQGEDNGRWHANIQAFF